MAETNATNDKYANSPLRAYSGAVNDISASGTDVRIALLGTGYTPDMSAHTVFGDVSGSEVSGQGYTAGGEALANKSLSESGGLVTFDADDVTWANSTISAQYAVIYDDTAAAGEKTLFCLLDFGQEMSSDDGDFTIEFDAAGIFEVDTQP